MAINDKSIDKAITQKWKEYKKVNFDSDTLRFVEDFVEEYYMCVREGLIDYSLMEDDKKNLLKRLLHVLDKAKNCQLYTHIKDWLENIDDEKLMVILVNDIFSFSKIKPRFSLFSLCKCAHLISCQKNPG